MPARLRLAFALVVAVIACDPYGVNTLAQSQFQAQCHVIFACCSPEERLQQAAGLAQLGIFDEQTCRDRLAAVGKLIDQANEEAVNAGRAKYDAELARKCSQAAIDAANACDSQAIFAPEPLPDDCLDDDGFTKSPLTGLVKNGDLCFQDFECEEEGARCVRNESENEDEILITTKGKCVGLPKVGESCADTFECAEGAFCDFDDETCKAVGGVGDECDGFDECGAGLRCDFSVAPAVCAEAGDDGDSCFNNSDCKNRCDFDTSLCAAKLPDGEDCFEDQECSGGTCDFNTGTCGEGAVDTVKRVVDQCDGKPD